MGAGQRPVRRLADAARIKTLGVRMDRHCDNPDASVAYLQDHEAVGQCSNPGLDSHPGHDRPRRQAMSRFGGMVSFHAPPGVPSRRSGSATEPNLFGWPSHWAASNR
ncbi:hypothetical protein GCM10020358_63020 [Amorphoplanes nipponensis]